jgi:hypothetical protein
MLLFSFGFQARDQFAKFKILVAQNCRVQAFKQRLQYNKLLICSKIHKYLFRLSSFEASIYLSIFLVNESVLMFFKYYQSKDCLNFLQVGVFQIISNQYIKIIAVLPYTYLEYF